ncbi:MAG TPA: 50S ribosomal protein L29 [Verrucomicrobia bacterium]|nr:MAG: 50S ribosomal protein L29 [Lentisphaerae bacterium GWF2_57_35]HBA83558.1 50S ribosomal protein L29 [Verrucomicrobiota bacterium]
MKASELKELTQEELNQRYEETHKDLFNLRIQQSTGQLEKSSRVRELRRDVARIKTIMKERAKASR